MLKRIKNDTVGKVLNSALVIALVVAIGGWLTQCQQNKEIQRLSYQMQQVSEFKASGAALDQAVVDVFDSLAKGGVADVQRSTLNKAVVEHVVRTEADREIFGSENAEEYLRALNVLRGELDEATDARNSGPRVSAFANVIEVRRKMMKQAIGS